MSPKGFTALLACTVLAVGLAAWAIAEREAPAASAGVDEPLFAGLADRLPEVAALQVTAEGRTLTIRKDGEVWRLAERGGYPVDPAKVREVARALTGLRLVEAKTASADRLPRLQLEDPEAETAKSKLVMLEGADGKPIAGAVLGRTKYGLYGGGRDGIYVRRAGEEQSWLAAGEVDLPGDAMGWIDTKVVDIPERDMMRVVLAEGGAEPIVITRPDAASETLVLDAVPEGQTADPEVLSRVAALLDNLTMTNVRPAADRPMPADAPRARFETRDGLAVTVAMLVEGEGASASHWVALDVGEGQPVGPAAEPSEVAKPLAERVAELKARLGGWQFELPSYLAERLTYSRENLLAKPEGTS